MNDPRLTTLAWAAYDAIYKWRFSCDPAGNKAAAEKEEEQDNVKGRIRMEQKGVAKA